MTELYLTPPDEFVIEVGNQITANQVPNLDASKITTGTLDAARIPNLDAGKITSGYFLPDRLPPLQASMITSGTLAAARLPIGSAVQAYDTDLDAIAQLATTSFGRSFLALATAAAARSLCNISKLLLHYQSFTAETATGSTAEVSFTQSQFTIPGGTLAAGSTLTIRLLFSFSTSTGNRTVRIKIGGVQLAGITVSSTSLSMEVDRNIRLRSLTSQITSSSTTQATGASASGTVALSLDFNQNQTISVSVQSPQNADTCTLESCQVWEMKP